MLAFRLLAPSLLLSKDVDARLGLPDATGASAVVVHAQQITRRDQRRVKLQRLPGGSHAAARDLREEIIQLADLLRLEALLEASGRGLRLLGGGPGLRALLPFDRQLLGRALR